jgi:hypothetical protein
MPAPFGVLFYLESNCSLDISYFYAENKKDIQMDVRKPVVNVQLRLLAPRLMLVGAKQSARFSY